MDMLKETLTLTAGLLVCATFAATAVAAIYTARIARREYLDRQPPEEEPKRIMGFCPPQNRAEERKS